MNESIEMSTTGCDYEIPRRSSEVRPRISSPKPLLNTSSPSVGTGVQGGPSVTPVNPVNLGNPVNKPNATLMVGIDFRLPTFNGNVTEDP